MGINHTVYGFNKQIHKITVFDDGRQTLHILQLIGGHVCLPVLLKVSLEMNENAICFYPVGAETAVSSAGRQI